MPTGKVKAIHNFILNLYAIRLKIKADALLLLQNIDLETLSNKEALSAYLKEMVVVISNKYLINNGKVPKETSDIIKSYVATMLKPK